MKIEELVKEVEEEIEMEKTEKVKILLKERLLEIKRAKRVLSKLESQLTELVNKDIDDVF